MDPYTLNRNIKKYLREKKIRKCDFARRIGKSPQVVSNMVHNKRKIYADEILPICKALGVSVAEIYAEG